MSMHIVLYHFSLVQLMWLLNYAVNCNLSAYYFKEWYY